MKNITKEALAPYAVNSADMLAMFVTKDKAPRKPFAKRQEGRKRRKERLAAIRAKSAWMDAE